MITQKASSVGGGIALGLLALVVVMVLLGASTGGPAVALARSDGGIIHVAITGSDAPPCGDVVTPCRTVQHAVDLALPGDEIRVAAGIYTDLHMRPDITQVVYISEAVTIRGGYKTTEWDVPDPAANPTILDAGGQGRVVYVAPGIAPVTLENLSLTGGDTWAAGPNEQAGGGVFIRPNATATVSNCRIFDNKANWGAGLGTDTGSSVTLNSSDVFSNTAFWGGGGLQLYKSTAALSGCKVFSNTASNDEGGGLYVTGSTATLDASQVLSNTAALRSGGGLYVFSGTITLTNNIISSNHATIHGGGMSVSQATATLTGNTISNNTGDYGGGANIERSVATLDDNRVFSNFGSRGGGLFVYSGTVTVTANQISTNTATVYAGGGVYLSESPATLSGNKVFSNTAGYAGGGLHLEKSAATLSDNKVFSNTAGANGGGLYLEKSAATLIGNDIFRNVTKGGGGLGLLQSPALLINNLIAANTATTGLGGGLNLSGSNARFVNTIIVDNQAGQGGNGLFVTNNSFARLLHTTLTRNVGDGGVGIFCCDGGNGFGSVAMTNTILVSQTVGVLMGNGCTATLEATLWGSGVWANGQDIQIQGPIVTGTHNYWGNPGFVDYASGDYHISAGSKAQDRGVDAGVTTDRDGRPRTPPPDLGAYEWQGFRAYLPLVLRGFAP